MPYIKRKDRLKISNETTLSLSERLGDIGDGVIHYESIDTAGELQYAMAVMFKSYMSRKGLNYQNCNDIMGALVGAQMEFYRRTVAPYENSKIKENGDV